MSDEVLETNDEALTPYEVLDERGDVERERDEYLDALQRLQADFENYRKRVARSSEEAATRAAGDLVARLLPTLDAFDLATAHFASASSDEVAALVQTRGLLLDTLSREGLERIDDASVTFDPQIHDAVAHVDADGETSDGPIVEDVLRAGYRWRGTVLRPAMVRVKG
ncbi:MAG: nucleotide exchange factor GrpE [Acidobacteriota bacterium]|nr:nucleotide exchange factor GrpE [Acidobacteriota bacterium]MDE3107277.1 nucleotide exchange factor GrpE [Acidobacteriota bacterium]MDE3221906.1 nucleotide exchange factor GrpE [Acidobacteriota bacterium]